MGKSIVLILIVVILFPVSDLYGKGKNEELEVYLKNLPVEKRDEISWVTEDYTIHVDREEETFYTDSVTLEYLIERPPLTAAILSEVGIMDYEITMDKGGIFHLDDRNGVTAEFEQIYTARQKKVYYGKGMYKIRLLPGLIIDITGKGIVILEYSKDDAEEDSPLYINLNFYGKTDNKVLDSIFRIFTTIVNLLVDRKISSYISNVREISEWIYEAPEEVYKKIDESEDISKEELMEYKRIFLSKHKDIEKTIK